MKTSIILFKVFSASNMVVGSVLLFICVLLGYDWKLILSILSMAAVFSLPPVVLLFALFLLLQKIRVRKIAAWMVLFGSIPLIALVPAVLFDELIPGDMAVLTALGILGSYAGILIHALRISELFNSFQYETE